MLLERDSFLASLHADLEAAGRGAGRTVLVSGEAGIGKTSLLEQFTADCGAPRVLWGACEALSTPHPLGPLHDVAREARGPLRAMLAHGAPRAEIFDAVLDELAAPPGPAVLVVEDLHWADAATLDLVRFLGRRVHRAPALMVLSYRDDDLAAARFVRSIVGHLPARHVSRLALPPLSSVAVEALAKASRCSSPDLHGITGGNPFFVTEVLAHPAGGVPSTVRDAVLGRAAGLTRAARDVLELASLVPRAVERSLIDAVLGAPWEALEECMEKGLLLADARTVRFRHELARVAIEESIPAPRACMLHARALAALAQRTEPAGLARLVHHARLAQDGEAVLRLAPAAAREAAARGARREAAAHCRVALEFADALPAAERAALLEEYAAHCFELNELSAAIAAREAAIEAFGTAGDAVRQSESLALHAVTLVRALRNAEADEASRRSLALAQRLPPGGPRARAYATEAYLRMLNRDYAEAIAWGEKAIAMAERCDAREVLSAACNFVGAAMLFSDYERGLAFVGKSLAIAAELPDGGVRAADAYVMLGTGSGEVFELANATRFLAEGIAFARSRDLDRFAGYMEAWQALIDMYLGRWEAAGERANEVIGRDPAGSTNRLTALVALGRLRVRRGDPGAGPALDEALVLGRQSGTLQRMAPVHCARAEAAWLARDVAALRAEVAGAWDLARTKGHPWFLGELAYWSWQAGERNEAPPGCAEPYALQIAGRAREAASAWAAIGCPYEQARALAEGDEAAQREALAILDRLGARPLAERVRRQLRAAGVQAVPRGPRASTQTNPAGLTTREVEVLQLVAQGLPSAQIAARLSRSPRTVEHHVEAILAKLDAGSRLEAVAAARERGLLPKNG